MDDLKKAQDVFRNDLAARASTASSSQRDDYEVAKITFDAFRGSPEYRAMIEVLKFYSTQGTFKSYKMSASVQDDYGCKPMFKDWAKCDLCKLKAKLEELGTPKCICGEINSRHCQVHQELEKCDKGE